ncbi:MAG: hypothetical protein ABIT36_01210 [Steroidobacteraceae bacterium]
MNDKASSNQARCAYCGTSSNPLEVQELQRTIAARDKVIALLRRRIDGVPSSTARSAAESVALEQIVARKTAELERQRFELEKVLHELHATQQRLREAQEKSQDKR